MTTDQYKDLVQSQGGLCAVCCKRQPRVVDHCHTTGAVRGALCYRCNNGIGLLGDSVEGLQAALSYLAKFVYASGGRTPEAYRSSSDAR